MQPGHAGKQALALGPQVDFHDPLVVATGPALQQPESLAA